MNQTPAPETPASAGTPSALSPVTLWLRRVHLFTGLFLGPWMLMYALSTLVMAHRELVLSLYPTKTPAMATERELDYTRSFPTTATREEIGKQILQDLDLEGRYSVSGGRNGQPLVVTRQHAVNARRITFDPAAHKLVIQKEEFRALTFLERMHRRRGYDQPYASDDAWGFTVDVAMVTMVFWSLSGIWLWWELKPARRWGAISLAAGPALFALLLFFL